MDKFVDITVRVPVLPDGPSAQDVALAVHSACQEFTGTVFKPFGATVLFFLNKAEVIQVSGPADAQPPEAA
ncbi:hypothetical protein [Paraburkholderia tropica]|uniref:hypothetical protein n=1 Tax=Paraburkholderia tropica TaxID=92647 RepID=UPI003D2911EE